MNIIKYLKFQISYYIQLKFDNHFIIILNSVRKNNCEFVDFCLKKDNNMDEVFYSHLLIGAITKDENNEIIICLINNINTSPCHNGNEAIRAAYYYKNYDIVNLLWKDQRVKESLKKDELSIYIHHSDQDDLLYKYLELQNKIQDF